MLHWMLNRSMVFNEGFLPGLNYNIYISYKWVNEPINRAALCSLHANINLVKYFLISQNWYNKLVGHSDVVGASPVGAAVTTSSLST